MNDQENSPNQQVEPDDGTVTDRELKNLLNEWMGSEPTAALSERVISDYRLQFHHRPWWRRWFAESIRLPVPVAAMGILLLCATSYLAIRKVPTHPVEVKPVRLPPAVVQVPVPVIHEKVVTRVVRAKVRPKKVEDESNALAQTDLMGFRPVSEIKIIVVKGRQEK